MWPLRNNEVTESQHLARGAALQLWDHLAAALFLSPSKHLDSPTKHQP